MQIPERQLSELAESVRDFERSEEELTECWRIWRMYVDTSRENNPHFDRERHLEDGLDHTTLYS